MRDLNVLFGGCRSGSDDTPQQLRFYYNITRDKGDFLSTVVVDESLFPLPDEPNTIHWLGMQYCFSFDLQVVASSRQNDNQEAKLSCSSPSFSRAKPWLGHA